mmetsp:Transcript_140444/g.447730  ORF Transcript_140444/g.447730 Transcript_140444/m.447730 type:complete len:350 (+) Transcript_140444:392-1441(+)
MLWQLTPLEDGSFKIRNFHTGLYMNVEGGWVIKGAPVWQWDNPQEKSSQWSIQKHDDGVFNIKNVNSGLFLTVKHGATDQGASIWQWDHPKDEASHWEIWEEAAPCFKELWKFPEAVLASTTTTTTAAAQATMTGLYCWAVSWSTNYEAIMTKDHFSRKESLFACDAYSVFTDDTAALQPVPSTSIGPLQSKMAPWGSWYNTRVFLNAWEAVIKQGLYKTHAWTVKVDIDAVFFPDRLVQHLTAQGLQGSDAVFVKNEDVMLGPIEVFSGKAMSIFAQSGQTVCSAYIDTSGEDGFFNDCMLKLGVVAHIDGQLLRSGGIPDYCLDHSFVCYHPFKDNGGFNSCMSNSQ